METRAHTGRHSLCLCFCFFSSEYPFQSLHRHENHRHFPPPPGLSTEQKAERIQRVQVRKISSMQVKGGETVGNIFIVSYLARRNSQDKLYSHTIQYMIKYLYFQQRLLFLTEAVFFLQQALPPQEGLQGCGLPRGNLTFWSQLSF